MLETVSRRRLLSSTGALAGGALAGCAGSDESDGADCETLAVSGGDTDGAVQEARVAPADGRAVLTVVLNPDQAGGVDAIRVDGSTDDYRIPLLDEAPERVYRQSLGPIPQNGRLRIAAVNQEGEALDRITVEFRCERPPTEGGGGEPEPGES